MSVFRSIGAIVRRRSGGRVESEAAPSQRKDVNGGTTDIAEFFLQPENLLLYPCCPFRSDLAAMHLLDEGTRRRIKAHMLGHLLDLRCLDESIDHGKPTRSAIYDRSVDAGLRHIYNDLNNRALNDARQAGRQPLDSDDPKFHGDGPEQRGCFDRDAEAELVAEAMRAYMTAPNYIKSVAPDVAKRIRDVVNVHPVVSKQIQFN